VTIAGIILAAGMSRRMGENKLLLTTGGEPMVRHAASLCQAAGLSPIIAVLGHQADQLRQALADLPVQCVINENFATGMASSLSTGLDALPAETSGVLVCLGDMPLVTTGDVFAICAAFAPARNHAVCIPVHEGRRGNPVLLGRQIFDDLASISGDEGAKTIIRKHADLVVEVQAGPGVLMDIDMPETYAALCKI